MVAVRVREHFGGVDVRPAPGILCRAYFCCEEDVIVVNRRQHLSFHRAQPRLAGLRLNQKTLARGQIKLRRARKLVVLG
jgi:hypothetical protein